MQQSNETKIADSKGKTRWARYQIAYQYLREKFPNAEKISYRRKRIMLEQQVLFLKK